MSNYITIDGGTTNTRISLVREYQVVDTLSYPVGARARIDHKTILGDTIQKGIKEILANNRMSETDITRILASGMITSEFGLLELKHLTAPAGIKELHASMQEVLLEPISSIPFVFMRGIKMDTDDWENADMMRGEETELMGITEGEEGIYILPGSHSKIIKTDSNGKIVHFKTMLTGEMTAAISQNTILKDSVDLNVSEINREYLLKGYEFCSQNGINAALFKVRVLKNLFGKNPAETYSFYMGIILCDEIRYILSQNPGKIVIGGRKQIKELMAMLLLELSDAEVVLISDEEAATASLKGMIKIYEYAGE